MKLFNILKGKNKEPEDERTVRLKGSRDSLKGFLKKVGIKRDKSTTKRNTQVSEDSDKVIDEAGRICYNMTETVCPQYHQRIAGRATPKNLLAKRERDKVVCETAEAFSEYVDFFLAHKGTEDLEYGIIEKSMPIYPEDQGKYTDEIKMKLQYKLNLPVEKLDNLKNQSIKTSCTNIEGSLSSFVGAINHSGLVQEILDTPMQLEALEGFITGLGRDISDKTSSLGKYQEMREELYELSKKVLVNGEREQRDLKTKNLEIIKEALTDLIRNYENEKRSLLEQGIDYSNIPKYIIDNVREIGEFVAEVGKYKTQRVIDEEEQRQTARVEKRKSGLLPTAGYNPAQEKTKSFEQFAREKTGSYKRPSKIVGTDSSALWGDTKKQ